MAVTQRRGVETFPVTEQISMTSTDCAACGIPFWVPEVWLNEKRRTGKSFSCPNGHSLSYTETDAQRLKKQVERLQSQRDDLLTWGNEERERRRAAERSNTALKGVVTRTKRRVGKGTCPCCNRHFEQLGRHMQSKHPEYAEGAS